MKLSCAAAAALVTCSTYAQVVVPPSADPGALQQRRIEEDQRRLEQERLERTPAVAPVIEAPKAPATAPVASQVRFKVNAVKFAPASEVLSAEELQALADAFAVQGDAVQAVAAAQAGIVDDHRGGLQGRRSAWRLRVAQKVPSRGSAPGPGIRQAVSRCSPAAWPAWSRSARWPGRALRLRRRPPVCRPG